MSDPARDDVDAETSPPERLAPPCAIALVFAVSQEAGGVIDRMQNQVATRGPHFTVYEGIFAGRQIAAVVGGAGKEHATRAVEGLLAAHRPAWLLSTGFAGGLVDDLARDAIFVANELVAQTPEEAGSIGVTIEPEWSGGEQPLHFATGRLLLVDRVIATPEEKRALHKAYDAATVDMESYAVARIADEVGLRFLSVRVISDAVDDRLPVEVGNLLNQQSFAGRLGAVAGALFKRPSSVKDLYRLKENALVSSDRLANFLATLLPRLRG